MIQMIHSEPREFHLGNLQRLSIKTGIGYNGCPSIKKSLTKGGNLSSIFQMQGTLLLINPWIYDFAAYDLWSKPLGLLTLAAGLRRQGYSIRFLDCMDVYHPLMYRESSLRHPVRRAYGTGKFWRERVPHPSPLQRVPRPYSRYGIRKEVFLRELGEHPPPAAVLVTSLMTYWYPGVQEVINLVKTSLPGVPVILGGIYATLCRDHALEHSGADHLIPGAGKRAFEELLALLRKLGIPEGESFNEAPGFLVPAFDLMRRLDYVCLSTSSGCPYHCQYCASGYLQPLFLERDRDEILEEILYWHRDFGVRDFAFYDDALLVHAENRMIPIMEDLVRMGLKIRFHTPNALHVREITGEIARLMIRSGFRTIRLGLETSDMELQDRLGGKVSQGEFERATGHLHRAGYEKKDIGAYILAGLPGQSVESVIDTIRFVDSAGAMPYLAEYSPIPHTALWEDALNQSEYDLAGEPLYHNNTLWPCWDSNQRERVPELKGLVREIRHLTGC